ncbi:MAG: nucleoside phosphorylase [Desulfobacterales bacterium]|nr:nucleoside phosphorylase [Desulfobacterales bacterium]
MTQGIVTPPEGPKIPELAVLAASQPDSSGLIQAMGVQEMKRIPMPMKLYEGEGFSISGPFMGAPQAAMLMENLAKWGAKRFLFVGWCGSVTGSIAIGETLLVTGAFVDEGTSLHYGVDALGRSVAPCETFTASIRESLTHGGVPFQEGKLWTTDGFYRETPERIRRFKDLGATGVEMESSALFSVACYLKVSVAALMTVSDDISGLAWNKGFSTPAFKQGRKRTLDAIEYILKSNESN